jgi:adenosylcobinamide-GDP ribazoletransferase
MSKAGRRVLLDVPDESGAAPGDDAPRAGPPWLRGARAAFLFFSRLPVAGFPYRPRDWHWAPAHLPLVGGVVGAASAGAFVLAARLGLAPLLGAALALGTSAWLTGALHEDGLADSADGLGGSSTRERALEIMKDSRIGSYGALALLLGVLARAAAIAALEPGAWFALVHVHVWARVGPVWLLRVEPYVNDRPDAKSQGLFETRTIHVLSALGWGVFAALLGVGLGWLTWPAALAGALAPLGTTLLARRYLRRRIGGVTGDLLGAVEQLGEVAAWVAFGVSLRR